MQQTVFVTFVTVSFSLHQRYVDFKVPCRSVKGLCYSIKILTVKVCTSFSLQYSSLIVIGIDGDTRPPLLLVTMGTLPGRAEPGGVGVVVDAGCGCCIFFLLTFLSLARRFWNQIFTCQQHAMSHTEKTFPLRVIEVKVVLLDGTFSSISYK